MRSSRKRCLQTVGTNTGKGVFYGGLAGVAASQAISFTTSYGIKQAATAMGICNSTISIELACSFQQFAADVLKTSGSFRIAFMVTGLVIGGLAGYFLGSQEATSQGFSFWSKEQAPSTESSSHQEENSQGGAEDVHMLPLYQADCR